jgi:hypothetical protein
VPAEIWTSFREIRFLRRVEMDLGISVRIFAAPESIDAALSLSCQTQGQHLKSPRDPFFQYPFVFTNNASI